MSRCRALWSAFLPALILSAAVAGCGPTAPAPAVVAVAAPRDEPPLTSVTPTYAPTFTPTVRPPTSTPTLVPTRTPTPMPSPTRAAPIARPVAVVVENDPAARPQTGLLAADVVYEAVAEWDLSRFVAVFTDGDASKVGPVRSARAYHAAAAAEYGAVFAHCLDVPPVGAVVVQSKVRDFDGCRMQSPPGFDRDASRPAPHNLYVSVAEVRRAAGGGGTYGAFGRRADWPDGTVTDSPVSRISFVYPEDHPVEWHYDVERREYLRWQDGEPHLLSDGAQMAASAVVVQVVDVRHSAYFGEAGYHEVTTTGSGEAVVYAAGGKRAATWKRPSLAEPTRFVDASGAEVLLPPGRVFVQLVERGTKLSETR